MFDVTCPTDDARVLVWNSLVHRARNLSTGIELDYRCPCGAEATVVVGRGGPWTVIRHDRIAATAA